MDIILEPEDSTSLNKLYDIEEEMVVEDKENPRRYSQTNVKFEDYKDVNSHLGIS